MLKSFFYALAAVSLSIVGGCGGSSAPSSAASPTASPAPTLPDSLELTFPVATPAVRAEYVPTGYAPRIQVSWKAKVDAPLRPLLEYQVYRDDVLIGTSGYQAAAFDDVPFLDGMPFTYTVLETINGVSTYGTRQGIVPEFTLGVPHVYRINVLFQQSDGTFAETTIGQSEPVVLSAP